MKNLMLTTSILLCALITCLSSSVMAQGELMITTSIAPNNPALLCSSESIVLDVEIENSGNVPITGGEFTIQLPDHVTQISCSSVCVGTDCSSNSVEVQVVSLAAGISCLLQIELEIPCFDAADMGSPPIVVYENGNINGQFLAPSFFIQVVQPEMNIANFMDANSSPLLIAMEESWDVQQRIIGDWNQRTFDITVNSGAIEKFELTTNIEEELEFTLYKINFFSNEVEVGDVDYNALSPEISISGNEIVLDEDLLEDLILTYFGGEMTIEDRINVLEITTVVKCSLAPEDGTDFSISWPCCDNTDFKTVDKSRGVDVIAANNPLQVAFYTTTDPEPSQEPIDFCGDTATTIGYEITNSAEVAPYIEGSGGKQIVSVTVPFDDDWFDYSGIYLIYGDGPGEEHDLLSAPWSNWFTQSGSQFTLNVSAMPSGNTYDNEPFTDLYNNDGFYHELEEGKGFRIEFRDAVFKCNEGTLTGGGNISDCEQGAISPFGGTNINIQYRDMCDMVADPQTGQAINVAIHNFQQPYSATPLVELGYPDLYPGNSSTDISLNYIYSGGVFGDPAVTPSPFAVVTGEEPNVWSLFECNQVTYKAVIRLPEKYTIMGDVSYYPSPGNDDSPTVFTPPVATIETIGGENFHVYTLENSNFSFQGRFDFEILLDTDTVICPFGTGGYDDIEYSVSAVCDGCIGCEYTILCHTTQIYFHCYGPCDYGVGIKVFDTDTASFVFDRASFGFTSPEMTAMVDPEDPELALNRSYPCDLIEVSASGSMSDDPADEVFFMIEYTWNEAWPTIDAHDFFEFVDAQFVFKDPLTGIPISSYNLNPLDLQFNSPCTECSLEFHIDQTTLNLINTLEVDVDFTATIKVSEFDNWNTIPGEIFFTFNQVRGQFAGRTNGILSVSCDSWGDEMTVIKAEERYYFEPDYIACSGNNTPWWLNYGLAHKSLCNRSLRMNMGIYGGMGWEMDVFPDEYRPVFRWPQGEFDDMINFTLPTGAVLASVPQPVQFRRNLGSGNLQSMFLADYIDTTPDVEVSGYGGSEFPIVEHDGSWQAGWGLNNTILYGLRALIQYDCPITSENPIDDSALSYSKIKRPYSALLDGSGNLIYNEGCDAIEDYSEIMQHPESDFEFGLSNSIQNGDLEISQEQGTIGGFFLHYTHFFDDNNGTETDECAGVRSPVSVHGVWIKVAADGLTIDGVNVLFNSGLPDTGVQEITEGGDTFYFIQSYTRSNTVPVSILQAVRNFSIDYTVNPEDCIEDPYLNIEYGFTCNKAVNENIITNSCFIDTWSIPYSFEITALQMATTDPQNLSGSPCDPYKYVVEINNPHFSEVSAPEFSIDLHESFEIVGVSYSFGDITGPFTPWSTTPIQNCIGEICTHSFNLSELYMPDGNFPPFDSEANPLYLRITIQGDCDVVESLQPVTMHLGGTDLCGNDISDQVDNNGYFFTLNFLDPEDLTNCENECEPELLDDCIGIDNPFGRGEGRAVTVSEESAFELSKFVIASNMPADFHTAEIDPTTSTLNYGLLAGTTYLNGPSIFQARDYVNDILWIEDRLFVVGYALTSDGTDIFVSCSSTSGMLLWTKNYDFYGYDDIGVKILEMEEEGKLLVVGHSNGLILSMIIEASNGAFVASKWYHESPSTGRSDYVSDALKLKGESEAYVITGYSNSSGNDDIILLKIDGNLDIIVPPRLIGSEFTERSAALTQLGSSIFIAGTTDEFTDCDQIYLVEVTAANLEHGVTHLELVRVLDGGSSRVNDIAVTEDGNLIVVGEVTWRNSESTNCSDGRREGIMFKLKVDESGAVTPSWANVTPTGHSDVSISLEAVTTIYSQQIVGIGNVNLSPSDSDILIVYADLESGNSCCMDPIDFDIKETYSVETKEYSEKRISPIINQDYISSYRGEMVEYCSKNKLTKMGTRNIFGEVVDDQGITVFPNPARNYFSVQLESDYFKSIALYDMSGRLIFDRSFGLNGSIEPSFFEVQTESINPGVYLLHVEGSEKIWMKRISILK